MADTSLSDKKIGLLVWKLSNLWQSKLRKVLRQFNLTLNEYLILSSIYKLNQNDNDLSQNDISTYSGIDISVASVTFKLLEGKNLITRNNKDDNRKKIVEMLNYGKNLYNRINPKISDEEKKIFNKLQNESYNFTNSLKLLLGKSLRIKAKKFYDKY